jgi:hypothetical protein
MVDEKALAIWEALDNAGRLWEGRRAEEHCNSTLHDLLGAKHTYTRKLVVKADACSASYLPLVDVVDGLDKLVKREDGDFRFDKALQTR